MPPQTPTPKYALADCASQSSVPHNLRFIDLFGVHVAARILQKDHADLNGAVVRHAETQRGAGL